MRNRLAVGATALLRARQGSIAPVFAFSVLVVVGVTGLAVDSARGYGAKSHLQNSLDAAALATARRVSENPSVEPGEVFATFFNASRPDGHHLSIASLSVQRNGNSIEAEIVASMPALFMSTLGQDRMSIAARSVAEFGFGDIEVVLALDNTGSMAGHKLETLKTASRDLLETLSRNAPSPEKLRVGLVPFSKYVNVGLSNRSAPWIDVPADYTTSGTGCYTSYPNATKSNCRIATGTCTSDGVPYSCSWEQCDWIYGDPVEVCGPYTETHTWSGCVRSRSYPLNVKDDAYSTRIPAKMDSWCAGPITPLTSDPTVIRDAIDGMAADGDTYIPEGLMWGWRLLSPPAPFSESEHSPGSRVSRYLVLMTDGMNSVSPTDSGHDGNDAALANRYTLEACTNIKADGITLFTVAFEVGDTAIKDVLRRCASADGFFYDAIDASRLTAAFDAIGQQLVSLRIKK